MQDGKDRNEGIRRQVEELRSSIAFAGSVEAIRTIIAKLGGLKGWSSDIDAMIDDALREAGEREGRIATYIEVPYRPLDGADGRRAQLTKEFKKALQDLKDSAKQLASIVAEIKQKEEEYQAVLQEFNQAMEANKPADDVAKIVDKELGIIMDQAFYEAELDKKIKIYGEKLQQCHGKKKEIEESRDFSQERKQELLKDAERDITASKEILANAKGSLEEIAPAAQRFEDGLLKRIAVAVATKPDNQVDEQVYAEIMKQHLSPKAQEKADTFIKEMKSIPPKERTSYRYDDFIKDFMEDAVKEHQPSVLANNIEEKKTESEVIKDARAGNKIPEASKVADPKVEAGQNPPLVKAESPIQSQAPVRKSKYDDNIAMDEADIPAQQPKTHAERIATSRGEQNISPYEKPKNHVASLNRRGGSDPSRSR